METRTLQKILITSIFFGIKYFSSSEGQTPVWKNETPNEMICPSGYVLFRSLCIRDYIHPNETNVWFVAKNICSEDNAQLFVIPINEQNFTMKNETWSDFAVDKKLGIIIFKRTDKEQIEENNIESIASVIGEENQCFTYNYTQTKLTAKSSSCQVKRNFRCALSAKVKYLTQVPWCPQRWLGSESAYIKQKCYFLLFQEDFTYEKAQERCKSLGSDLVISKEKLRNTLHLTFRRFDQQYLSNDIYTDVDERSNASIKNHFLCEKQALEDHNSPRVSLKRRTNAQRNCIELICKGESVHPHSWIYWYMNDIHITKWDKISDINLPKNYTDLYRDELQSTICLDKQDGRIEGEFYCEIGGSNSVPKATSNKITVLFSEAKMRQIVSVDVNDNGNDEYDKIKNMLKELSKCDTSHVKTQEIRLFQRETGAFNVVVHLLNNGSYTDWTTYDSNFENKKKRNLQMNFNKKEIPSNCSSETIDVRDLNSLLKPLQWPTTALNNIIEPNETCITDEGNNIKRKCSGDFIRGASWEPITYDCIWNINNRTISLHLLSKSSVSTLDGIQISEKLLNLSKEPEPLLPEDVNNIAKVLENLSVMDQVTETMENIGNVIEVLMNTKEETLRNSSSSSSIPQYFENILSRTNSSVRIDKPTFYAEAIVYPETEGIIGISGSFNNLSQFDSTQIKTMKSKESINSRTVVSLILPVAIKMYNDSHYRMNYKVYNETRVFSTSQSTKQINSLIVGAVVDYPNSTPDYSSTPVLIIFQPLETNVPLENHTCVFWDVSLKDWSEHGCWLNETKMGKLYCCCTHLTHFAVLMDVRVDKSSFSNDHVRYLSIITYVGCALSILGLTLTILTFALFKKWRKKTGNRILCNLSFSLLFVLVIFLGGITEVKSPKICIAVAILLHYFLLATFAWMLVEGILLYVKLVRVLNSNIPRFVLKSMICAWGIPLIVVATVIGIDVNLYRGSQHYCWMSSKAQIYSLLLPIGIIIVVNFIIFIRILQNICCNRKIVSSTKRNSCKEIFTAICICVLLGLTWGFGFLMFDVWVFVNELRTFSQYLFCISNSLQGFLIFALMVIRDNNAQDLWIAFLSKRKKYFVTKSSVPKRTKNTVETISLEDKPMSA